LELVHDVATELCIRNDEDEGLFAGYSSVDFLAPVRAGDFLEATGAIVRIGNRSREMTFEIVRYARQRPELSETAATVLERPEVVLTARGTCVVPRGRS
jgi:3-aminobutyryl-CoA ammonia-lyase